MSPCSCKPIARLFPLTILILCFFIFGTTHQVLGGDPEYYNPATGKPFVFALGVGYGVSNNPCTNCNDEELLHGISLSGSIGYHIGRRFMIDFGPVVWIRSEDIFSNNLPSGERTSSKRMLVSFNGYYQLHKKFPLTLKLGAGVGSMVYSPERTTVSADGKKNKPTEYFSGPAATGSLIYQLNVSDKITVHPSLNFWYTNLQKQQIDYVSSVDHSRPSLTSDLRILVYFNF